MDNIETSDTNNVKIKSEHDSLPGQTTISKSDLSRTKTELFSKLIASQPQQMIVTTPNSNNVPENSNRSSSLIGNDIKSAVSDQQHQPFQQSNSGKQLSNNQNFLPDDFKREPVVFTRSRSRWYTNEEVASILTSFSSHPEWQTSELQIRPKSGAVLLYSREKVRYRQDGYCWKKRKNGRTTREDHMKLKVQGIECIYGCYVHSAILPTFHRRCYWLLQNPDIVLVHYLNQPPDDQNKMMITFNSSLLEADTRRSWTNEQIIEEIGSVFGGISQIQHTLNINFPSSTSIISQQHHHQQQQQQLQSREPDRMIESSPQSQQSQATTNSEAMNEQIDMTIVDQRQLSNQNSTELEHQIQHTNDRNLEEYEDELMAAVNQETSSGGQTSSNRQPNNLNCEGQVNGHELQHQQDTSTNMTIDIVNESSTNNDSNNLNTGHSRIGCFNYTSSNDINANVDAINSNDINNQSSSLQAEQTSSQLEQNLCSPVTQIYNKIVDDIETYALPLEPNQFNSSHHHHNISISPSPVQSMDLAERRHLNHHQLSQSQEQQARQLGSQYNHSCSSNNNDNSAQKDHPACSMVLTTCDIFGSEQNRVNSNSREGSHENNEEDNLILTGFDSPSNDAVHANAGVVDSLANVDDLSDLIMGISSNENVDHNTLLVDTSSLDLFNFKPDCVQRQQLDVKSLTSDTDTMNRLSPLVLVPRCNSTGNAMQTTTNCQHQQQHLSNQFLTCDERSLVTNNVTELQTQNSQPRSASTQPCGSNLSHLSSSLRTGLSNSNQSARIESTQYTESSGPTSISHSMIKLPLHQRQRSEQQESCNSVLSTLLPKAVSLDGNDLSATRGSPLVGLYDDMEHERQRNLLLIPSSINQQSPSNLGDNMMTVDSYNQNVRASLSPTIPMDNSSEILVNNAPNNFCGSPSYNMMQVSQQQQQQPTTNPMEYTKRTTSNLLPILDYVPNWCNITGGAKVLIVGKWSSLLPKFNVQQQHFNASDSTPPFFAIFDDLLVPATLIQENVLRCYAPSHEQGFITLKVLYMNSIVSEQVLFEMRPSCNQFGNQDVSYHSRNNQDGGHDSSDNNNNGNNNTQHRNSTSSNQSAGSSAFVTQTKPQASPSGNSLSSDNSKVLTLAENIISAMHKKNNNNNSRLPDFRLASSLDIESLDHYQPLQKPCQRQRSLKGTQRHFVGSRSLSRDSDPVSNYATNFGIIDADPYWHHNPLEPESMQPLSVVTDFVMTNQMQASAGIRQQRHSSGSSVNQLQQQSTFTPHITRSSLASQYYVLPPHNQPFESQNQTETSSSGLGSIVSSLSPSTSSLYSPSSNCTATHDGGRDNQSPCSCGRQSTSTPTSADFCEYFQASERTEESFASLTLNDREQQELYEAAKIIQKAYRTYRGRKRQASELSSEPIQSMNPNDQLVYECHSNNVENVQQTDLVDEHTNQHHLCNKSVLSQQHYGYMNPHSSSKAQAQQQQAPALVRCYRDREMQAATIIQAYYRRYRQYVHYKRQQQPNSKTPTSSSVNGTALCERWSSSARLVVDTLPIVIDKATTSHVDRKRFKTAALISSGGTNDCLVQQTA